MRHVPRVLALLLATIPVAALVFIVGSVLVFSIPAIVQIRDGLLGTQFAGTNQHDAPTSYGLLAPIWGTLLLAIIALGVAVPGAIALAILIEELPLGPLSRVLPLALGIMSGIPPIVYALLSLALIQFVMRPKFGGVEIEDEGIKAAIQGLPAYSGVILPLGLPNSQLLGGCLLALLIVPLIAPLVADALRGVPAELRSGSYALGASRWYTLRHVVVPAALPGIISATTLGALKAIGEVTIPYFAISYSLEVVRLPNPLWDVLWHTQPLSSTGALQLGGFHSEGAGGPGVVGVAVAVAYATGLVLLLFAFGLMGLAAVVQRRLGREVTG